MKLGRDEILMARTCVFRLFIRSALGGIQGRAKEDSKRASKTKGFTWNAAILVVVSARYSKG